MEVDTLARELESAQKASAAFDTRIAETLVWYQRRTSSSTKFFVVDGNTPRYTADLQKACDLLKMIDEDIPCAIVFENGRATAQLEGQPSYSANSAAMAVCVAAIQLIKSKGA